MVPTINSVAILWKPKIVKIEECESFQNNPKSYFDTLKIFTRICSLTSFVWEETGGKNLFPRKFILLLKLTRKGLLRRHYSILRITSHTPIRKSAKNSKRSQFDTFNSNWESRSAT